jgi:serine protease Do
MLDSPGRVHRVLAFGIGTFWTLAFSLVPPDLPAQETLSSIAAEVQKVFETAKGAVVRIEAEDGHGKVAGTGFFIDPAGTVYTAYEVGGESRDITVEFGESRYPARRLVADFRSNIAILKVNAETPWLPLGNSDEVQMTTPVITIGFPLDLPATPNFGMVGGLDRKYLNKYFPTILIRANIPAQRGEGGAPLLNLRGEVVGIVVSSIDNRTACYALPIRAAEKIRSDYVRFGEVRPGWLGVTVAQESVSNPNTPVTISGAEPGSPAADSGLRAGDVLLKLGSLQIKNLPDLINARFFISAQEDVPIVVLRDGEELTFRITATEHPTTQRRRVPLIAPGYPVNDSESLRLKGSN